MVDRFTALPWVAWLAVMSVIVTGTNNALVLAAAAVGCWASMLVLGGPRKAIGRLLVAGSGVIAVIWALLGVMIHREGLGGRIIWFLPTWSTESSGEFGGAVTVGQLHLAVARGCQALAILAMVALVIQAVPIHHWLRLSSAVWGRAARLFDPLVCLGEAYVDAQGERVALRRAGFDGSAGTGQFTDLLERSRAKAEAWRGQHMADPRRSAATSAVRATVGLLIMLTLTVGWAVEAISLDPLIETSGMELTIIVLAVAGLMGLAFHSGRPPRPTAGDLVPLLSAVIVVVAWYFPGLTRGEDVLVRDFAEFPPVPTSLVVALIVLPSLAAVAGGRR